MKRYRNLVCVGLLLTVIPAIAAVRNATMQIKVLESDTSSVILDNSGVPKNCDMANYDAYCHNSIATLITHTLLVQIGNQAPFRVSCRLDSMWSRCRELAKGHTYEAKKEKRGISVYLVDEKGKLRQQLYTYNDEKGKGSATVSASATLAASLEAESPQPQPGTINDNADATVRAEAVKCDFTSAPAGADITVDGHYLGSTPSELKLNVGNHDVKVSFPGFLLWNRNLTVSSGSEVRVNAVLQKLQ